MLLTLVSASLALAGPPLSVSSQGLSSGTLLPRDQAHPGEVPAEASSPTQELVGWVGLVG